MTWQTEMVDQLKAAHNGEKDKLIARYAEMTGKSTATLYRIAKQHGFVSGRKKRTDAGTCAVTDQQLLFVSSLLHTSARELKGVIMPVEEALQIAEDNGIIEPGSCSAAWLSTLLRRRNMHRAALDAAEPTIRMRSLHPNHVHVYDASVCIQYYLKGRQGLRMMREDKFYKNKWENFGKIRRKLIRYVLTDHYSHCIFVKYYYTGGETQENLFDFLVSAWQADKHEKLPFRGVPFFVLMDAGAANISKAMIQWMERLDIEIPESMPHNPSRQGSAEKAQEIVESRFESKLRFQPAHTIDDLNAWALDWAVHWNSTKRHRRHGMTRTQCWLTIRQDHLRELPDIKLLQGLFAEPEVKRKVGSDYTIQFKSETFDVRHVPELVPNQDWVDVILRPFNWPEIGVVHNDTEHIVRPVGKAIGGFRSDAAVIGVEYKSLPESMPQRHKKIADNLAYGEKRFKDAVPFDGLTVFGNRADQVQHHYMPRKGRPMELQPTGIEDKRRPVITVLRELAALVEMTPELNQAVRSAYGTSIALTESNRLVEIAREHGELTINDLGDDSHAAPETIAV